MNTQEFIQAKKFDRADLGWITMSIGMAIGAGIVFLPVQVGVLGLWVFLLSSIVGYPAMYLFQRLFINTLATSKECQDYPSVISQYLGKNWGVALGALYFIMLIIWGFIYSLAITNDSASYLQSFGVTNELLSDSVVYPLMLISLLVWVASSQEKLLFTISGTMAIVVLMVVAVMSFLLIPYWSMANVSELEWSWSLIENAIGTLPFTLTSILFIQSLSPMVISYRARHQSVEVARYKALRAMNIAFAILFLVVFFFAISFTFAISHEQALQAKSQNISALAIIAQYYPGSWATIAGVVINLFAVVTSFFGVFLALREALGGLMKNFLTRMSLMIDDTSTKILTTTFLILVCWAVAISNLPILKLASFSGPIFGLVGCLIPAYLVFKVPTLHRYKTLSVYFIILTGLLLCIAPIWS
jgi:serine transporter